MVLGGIIVSGEGVKGIEEKITRCRETTKMHAELKWGKVCTARFQEYKAFTDLFFDLNRADRAHFHSIVVDTSKLNHRLYNQGDPETGFYKFYYQLLLHSFGGKYAQGRLDAKILVCLDRRNSSYPLDKLKELLNRGMEKKHGRGSRPFVAVEARDSKASGVLQLADILMGAVGFRKNGYHQRPGANKGKVQLAEHIASKVGEVSMAVSPQRTRNRFTVWNFRLQPRVKKKEDAPHS
jgi:hypothetical protein